MYGDRVSWHVLVLGADDGAREERSLVRLAGQEEAPKLQGDLPLDRILGSRDSPAVLSESGEVVLTGLRDRVHRSRSRAESSPKGRRRPHQPELARVGGTADIFPGYMETWLY